MKTIVGIELAQVSGGFWNFFASYFGGKAIDGLVEVHNTHVEEFAARNHTASNKHFEENRENFNPLL